MILKHINKINMKLGDIHVINVKRNLPKQIILRNTKQLPMKVANINVTNGIRIQKNNKLVPHKLTYHEGRQYKYVTNVTRNLLE